MGNEQRPSTPFGQFILESGRRHRALPSILFDGRSIEPTSRIGLATQGLSEYVRQQMALLLPFNDQTCETIYRRCNGCWRRGVIAIPTEASYGLAALHNSKRQALRRLFEIKGRPSDKPILASCQPRPTGPIGGEDSACRCRPHGAVVAWALDHRIFSAADLPSLLTAGTEP